jgi:hypothetical protein
LEVLTPRAVDRIVQNQIHREPRHHRHTGSERMRDTAPMRKVASGEAND